MNNNGVQISVSEKEIYAEKLSRFGCRASDGVSLER